LNIVSKARNVSLRKIYAGDLKRITEFEYSVSITEPHSNLDRLKQLYTETQLWSELSGAAAIVENSTNKLVGTCQYYRSAPCIHGLEIGYIIHDENDRGKGYASQALQLLSDHLFMKRPSIFRQQLLIEVGNTPSWRVAENCGFVREGILRNSGFGDNPANCFSYSKTKEDYEKEQNSLYGATS